MIGSIAPWMAEDFRNQTCTLPHANASPRNNRCGEGGTHWDLPPHPDEETRKVIEEHNKIDIELYEFAVQQFEYQRLALGLGGKEDE